MSLLKSPKIVLIKRSIMYWVRGLFFLSFAILLLSSELLAVDAAKTGTIKKNERLDLRTKVVISGIDDKQHDNAKAHLPVFKPLCNAEKDDVERYGGIVTDKLEDAMNALGFYDAKIEIKLSQPKQCWRVHAVITPGKPILVKSQDILVSGYAGEMHPLLKKAIAKKPYEDNEELNHKKYTDFKATLAEAAQAAGYLDFTFKTKQIRVDKNKYRADIKLHLETGSRYTFGNIEVVQDKAVLKGKYLSRFLLLEKGHQYSAEALIKQQQLFQGSGYYAVVRVEADHTKAKKRAVPIKIVLTAKKRTAYKFKIGYGTDTGARIKGEMNRRWTGKSGRQLSLGIGLSQRVNELEARMTIPKKNPEDNSVFYTIGWKRDSNDDVVSNAFKIGAVATSKLSNGWQRTLSIKFIDDRTTTDGTGTTHSTLTLLGLKYAKIKADDRLNPQNGWRVSLEAQGAAKNLLSDTSVFQVRAHAKYIRKIGDGRLILRGDIGTVIGDQVSDLPKDLRFFAGGTNSVRGYGYETLGTINADGSVIGSKNLLTGSVEYEIPINDSWGVAAFVDAGNAFDNWDDMDLKIGYGVGARWKSPIGPVRIDVAVPEHDSSDINLHLSIGPDL